MNIAFSKSLPYVYPKKPDNHQKTLGLGNEIAVKYLHFCIQSFVLI
jgi:hypothetical protein